MEAENLDQRTCDEKPEGPETLAEMLNRALESTHELVANFNRAHEARLKREERESGRPSSDKSP
jgi:hypothetical protein